jgi:hypothetical protein
MARRLCLCASSIAAPYSLASASSEDGCGRRPRILTIGVAGAPNLGRPACSRVVTTYGTPLRAGSNGPESRDPPCETVRNRPGNDFFPQLIRQLSHAPAQADCRGKPVVGVTIQMVEEIFAVEVLLRHAGRPVASESPGGVDIDHRRDDGFACQEIRVAPAGSRIEPFLPIFVNRRSSTRNAEVSIGPLPSPAISRAPSNKIAPPGIRPRPGRQ